MRPREGTLLVWVLAAAAAGTGTIAVAQHNACTAAGYKLAEARREGLRLQREIAAAQERLAALRAPAATLARARAMGLALEYPAGGER
jgi:hypothetical protein